MEQPVHAPDPHRYFSCVAPARREGSDFARISGQIDSAHIETKTDSTLLITRCTRSHSEVSRPKSQHFFRPEKCVRQVCHSDMSTKKSAVNPYAVTQLRCTRNP